MWHVVLPVTWCHMWAGCGASPVPGVGYPIPNIRTGYGHTTAGASSRIAHPLAVNRKM